MTITPKNIGHRLSLVRKDKCLDRESLSNISHVSINNINSYESGRSGMNLQTAIKLADALGCTLDELACRSDYVCKS